MFCTNKSIYSSANEPPHTTPQIQTTWASSPSRSSTSICPTTRTSSRSASPRAARPRALSKVPHRRFRQVMRGHRRRPDRAAHVRRCGQDVIRHRRPRAHEARHVRSVCAGLARLRRRGRRGRGRRGTGRGSSSSGGGSMRAARSSQAAADSQVQYPFPACEPKDEELYRSSAAAGHK